MKISALLVIACIVVAPAANAELYRWTDDQGVLHFSDVKPEGRDCETHAEIKDIKRQNGSSPVYSPITARCTAVGAAGKNLDVAKIFCKAFGESGVESVDVDQTIMAVRFSRPLYLGIRLRPDKDLLLKTTARKFMEASGQRVVTVWYYVGQERVAEANYSIWSGQFKIQWN